MNKFDFLTSPRFWSLVVGSASTILVTSFGQEMWYVSLGKFLGLLSAGFITIGTLDRIGDKKVEAAKVTGNTTTVTMPNTVSSVSATTSTSEKGI